MTHNAPHRMHRHTTVSRKPNAGAGCDDVYDEYDLYELLVKRGIGVQHRGTHARHTLMCRNIVIIVTIVTTRANARSPRYAGAYDVYDEHR